MGQDLRTMLSRSPDLGTGGWSETRLPLGLDFIQHFILFSILLGLKGKAVFVSNFNLTSQNVELSGVEGHERLYKK